MSTREATSRSMCLAMLWTMLATALVSAQTTAPARVSEYEGQPIRKTTAPGAPATRASASTSTRTSQFLDLPRVLMALAIVLGLVFVLRWLARRLFPNAVRSRASDAVRVLARSPITPRQQILLVHVGQRVLIVADNGTQLTALSEVKDPNEVSALIGQLNPTDGEAFRTALDSSQSQYEQPTQEAASSDDSLAPAQTEIAGLMDKVRVLAKQLGR